MIIIIMGVSGSGKTSVGKALAARLKWQFVDADDWHSDENRRKMSRGIPLTDRDRLPWLTSLQQLTNGWLRDGKSAVLACSALKESYREILGCPNPAISLVYLKGSFNGIQQHLRTRTNHFMPLELLQTQFEALEEPQSDVIVVSVDQSVENIVDSLIGQLNVQI